VDHRVFISYRGEDSGNSGALLYTDLTRRFGEDLVFLDAESILAGADFATELLKRVRSAQVVLAVIGPRWLTATDPTDPTRQRIHDPSDWIRRELAEAFAAGVRVIPVLTDQAVLPSETELPADIAALSRCQYRHLRHRESKTDLARIAADLTALDPVLAKAVSSSQENVWKLPPTGVFVGRMDELARLEKATADSGRVAVVALHGLGGVGKSTLAARFAGTYADRFSSVWWITADSLAAIDNGLADLATTLAPEMAEMPVDQRAQRALRWLSGHTGWLVILDDLLTPVHATRLLERVRTGTIIITSRQSTGWRNVTPVPLDVLAAGEAMELLERIVRAEWPEATLTDSERLCEELGHLPLAVEQAAAYIAQTHTPPAQYLDRLAAVPARMFTATAEGGDAQRTMARVWHVTLDRLTDTPLAGSVLRRLAWYAPDQIPRSLLGGPEGETELSEALGRLHTYSMITFNADTIRVHRLVQAVTRTPDVDDPHRHPEAIAQARDTTAENLARVLAGVDRHLPAHWPAFQAVLPHALALLDHTDADTAMLWTLAGHLSLYTQDQGDVATAIALATRAARICERLYGPDDPFTLTARNNLGRAYWLAGDLERAARLFEATLANSEQVQGADHPDTLVSRNNLAGAYEAAGDFERAILLLEERLADSQQILGPDHPEMLVVRNNLAHSYELAGDLGRAIVLYREALAHFGPLPGRDIDMLGLRTNLARTYMLAGDLERAIQLYEETLVDSERILGLDHQSTLRLRNGLASAYESVGDLGRAIPLYEKALADQERILGRDHPDTLTTRHDLAGAFESAGDPRRAIPLYKMVLADRERVLGRDHPDTLTTRNDLAYTYQSACDMARAIPLCKATLVDRERVLGPDHPHTLRSRHNLAYAYHAAGNPELAIPLYTATLADRERVLGFNHPDTIQSRNNLANTYHAAGDLRRAIPLYEAALIDAERVLGSKHPLTRIIRSNLGSATGDHN
jgi:tetratricopeptide (TPR) repeat protein